MGRRGDINVLEIYLKTILGIFTRVKFLKLIRKNQPNSVGNKDLKW
jgi:hypothetical protein